MQTTNLKVIATTSLQQATTIIFHTVVLRVPVVTPHDRGDVIFNFSDEQVSGVSGSYDVINIDRAGQVA